MKKTLAKPQWMTGPANKHWVGIFAACVLAMLLFMHPDAMETGNHSYLLLESLFSGRLRSFYGEVATHQNTLYYLNNAHYNITVYAIFALAQLPVFLFNAIFQTAVNEVLLSYIVKLVCGLFAAGCLPLVAAIGRQAGLEQKNAAWGAAMFMLWPPAFFSVWVMGQYDVICLFFMLLGLLYWMRGSWLPFALCFGAGIAIKMFPAFLFVPLLLLGEKRPLHILKNGLVALWLLVPTTLLYAGRTLSAGAFTQTMLQRLFAAKLPGAREIPVFILLFLVLCITAYFWRPGNLPRSALWLGLAVFGLLFLLVEWHPQWLVLLAPFAILTTLLEKQRTPWLFVDIAQCAGFFLLCAAAFPAQLEANLLDNALPGLLTGLRVAGTGTTLMGWYGKLDVMNLLPMVLFAAPLLAQLVFKLPLGQGSLACRLLGGMQKHPTNGEALNMAIPTVKPAAQLWLGYGIGFGLCWLLPTLAAWVMAWA